MPSSQFFMPFRPAYDANGLTVPGAQAYFTLAGTNTLAPVYSDSGLSTPLANPVQADAVGKFPPVYLDDAVSYRLRVYGRETVFDIDVTPSDTPIEEYDPYVPGTILTGPAGGNVMAIGLLKDAPLSAVPSGTDLVQTSGNEATGEGVSLYAEDAAITSGYLATYPKAGFVDSAGRGFRVLREELFMPQKFYQATDANFGFAINRAINYLSEAVAQNDDTGIYRGTRELFIPAGNYDCGANTIEPLVTMRIRGEFTGYADAGIGTRLRWNHGTTGIRINRLNTIGGSTIRANGHAADGCIVEGIFGQSTTAGTTKAAVEAEAHFIECRARAIIRECGARYWPGDGVRVLAFLGSSGPFEGNANQTFIERSSFQYCRNGINLDGDNSNACYTLGVNCSYNRQWGIWDSSFLANTHIAFHLDSNAGFTISGSDGSNMGSLSMAAYGGHIYACIPGQETWCSTNAPSGSTAHNQGWYYHADGGAGAFNARAWVSGMTDWRAGGPMCWDNANAPHFATGYCESGQPPSHLAVGMLVGNSFGNTALQYGTTGNFVGQILNDGSGLRSLGSMNADANLKAGGFVGIGGGNAGFFSAPVPTLSYDPATNGLQVFPKGGAASYDLMIYDGVGNQVARIPHGTRDWDLANGAFKVAGQQVVGARGAALPADATDLATAVTLVNAIKARMKTTGGHGLVAD